MPGRPAEVFEHVLRERMMLNADAVRNPKSVGGTSAVPGMPAHDTAAACLELLHPRRRPATDGIWPSFSCLEGTVVTVPPYLKGQASR